jgi:hypothetical protein
MSLRLKSGGERDGAGVRNRLRLHVRLCGLLCPRGNVTFLLSLIITGFALLFLLDLPITLFLFLALRFIPPLLLLLLLTLLPLSFSLSLALFFGTSLLLGFFASSLIFLCFAFGFALLPLLLTLDSLLF